MLDLIKAVALATEAHEGQYRKAIKVFPVNEHTLYNHEITKLQQNNGTDFSICKEDGEYSMNTHLELFIAKPYITHPLTVMNMLSTEEEKIVAVLHDVFEKCPGYVLGRVMDDSAHWIKIKSTMTDIQISERIYWALHLLNHPKSMSYTDYIKQLISANMISGLRNTEINRLATKVKIADLTCNLLDNPSQRQKSKYSTAMQQLLKSL